MTDPNKSTAMPLPSLPPHPMVSIITVNRNHGDFLEETILSVLKQDYPFIEHIVMDGASTDNSLEILKRHQGDSRLRWVSEPDPGPDQATIRGMQMARGELIGVQDSTDTYQPGAIREAVHEFMKDPSLVLVGGCLCIIDHQGRAIKDYPVFSEKHNLSFDEIAGFNYPPLQATFFRRDLARETGWYLGEENLHSCHTLYFLHYLLEAWKRGGHGRGVPNIWGTLRVHENQRHKLLPTYGLSYFLERKEACRLNAERYKKDLTAEQTSMLLRGGHYFEFYHRVVSLHQILRALPSFLRYLRLGGQIPSLKKMWNQIGRSMKGWFGNCPADPMSKEKTQKTGMDTRWYLDAR